MTLADGVASFAAWTGRDGVCVPAVEVVAGVRVNGADATAGYLGPRRPIEVAADSDGPERDVVHELCHAIDEEEGLSDANPGLFPEGSVAEVDLYPSEALRRTEAFARACEGGPGDPVEASARVRELCGTALADRQQRLVDEVGYREAPWAGVSDERLPLGVTAGTIPTEADVLVAVGTRGDDLTLLVADEGGSAARVLLVDAGSAVTADVPLDGADLPLEWGLLADGVVLATHREGDAQSGLDGLATRVLRVEGDALVDAGIALAGVLPLAAAVADGVVYVDGIDAAEATGVFLRAWDLASREEVAVAAPPFLGGAFVARDGGFATIGDGRLARYDRAGDAWELVEVRAGFPRWMTADGALVYLVPRDEGEYAPAAYDPADGLWRFGVDPCADAGQEIGGYAVSVGGRHLLFPEGAVGGGVPYLDIGGAA